VSAPTGSARPGARRSGWIVGIIAVAALAYVLLNTLRTEGPGSRGPAPGSQLPPFAAPLATSALEGDVNVARRAGQGDAGDKPACAVRGSDVVNSCQLAERGPVVVAFLATRGARCVDELDVLERVHRGHPRVQVAAVAIRGDRDALRRLVRQRGWSFPVAYDHDGILANLYGVAVCPHLTFADRGGRVRGSLLGHQDAAALERRFAALERAR
jgi:peroxiredoxin